MVQLVENWQRTALAWLAVACLATGAGLVWWQGEFSPSASSCFKIGALLGTLWLATPDLNNPRTLAWLGVLVVLVVAAIWFKALLPVVVGAAVLLALLRPRAAGWMETQRARARRK